MPSPLGHALAGVAAAWAADLVPGRRQRRATPGTAPLFDLAGGTLTMVCAALAALPDLDLAFESHRSLSHSVGALALVTILSAAVTGWVTRRQRPGLNNPSLSVVRVAAMCGAAYATHLLLDWLGSDARSPRGLQVLWPFSDEWYISDWNLFPRTERRALFSFPTIRTNLIAMASETAILLPVVFLVWLVRVKALAGLAAQVPARDHSSQ